MKKQLLSYEKPESEHLSLTLEGRICGVSNPDSTNTTVSDPFNPEEEEETW